MKKFKLLVVVLAAIILLPFNANAAKKDPINVYIFKGDGCGYCAAALEFFESIEDDYGKYFDLVEYEVWYNEDNAKLMTDVASYFGEEIGGVPYIVIGDKTFQGYAESYNEDIKSAIKNAYDAKDYVDAIKAVNDGEIPKVDAKEDNSDDSNKTTIIIIAVALVGFVALFYFARDTEVEEVKEEKKETKVVEEPKKEEVKKSTPKKTASTKKTTSAKKSSTTKKTTTTKTSASKKTTTTKKAPAKKTTTKKATTKK